jgi:ABC-type sugar transport system ATPase subunit
VSLVEPLGSEQIVYVDVPGGHDFVAAVGPDTVPRIDEPVTLGIPGAAMHFFDAETGSRI